ncbi:MAG: hypothetical protein K9J83_05190 [Desulfarculaceae bacterium]|nr:hypothetical protein [Desulfarculaceae bacterium]
MYTKQLKTIMAALAVTVLMSLGAFAADSSQEQMEGHDMKGNAPAGMKIHEAEVDGYRLEYRLIDMKAKMKDMENMPEMEDTHHLMVYVKTSSGDPVSQAMAGYLIENPDGTEQKKMTMAMAGGFGADINLEQQGSYTVKAKIMAEKNKLIDSFSLNIE